MPIMIRLKIVSVAKEVFWLWVYQALINWYLILWYFTFFPFCDIIHKVTVSIFVVKSLQTYFISFKTNPEMEFAAAQNYACLKFLVPVSKVTGGRRYRYTLPGAHPPHPSADGFLLFFSNLCTFDRRKMDILLYLLPIIWLLIKSAV